MNISSSLYNEPINFDTLLLDAYGKKHKLTSKCNTDIAVAFMTLTISVRTKCVTCSLAGKPFQSFGSVVQVNEEVLHYNKNFLIEFVEQEVKDHALSLTELHEARHLFNTSPELQLVKLFMDGA